MDSVSNALISRATEILMNYDQTILKNNNGHSCQWNIDKSNARIIATVIDNFEEVSAKDCNICPSTTTFYVANKLDIIFMSDFLGKKASFARTLLC